VEHRHRPARALGSSQRSSVGQAGGPHEDSHHHHLAA
jgi:hypothetical protein